MFIAIYGVNNLGKTTQAKKIVQSLIKEGYEAEYIKYPIYGLEPTGSMLNDYLRGGNPKEFNHREAQTLYVLNRFHYQPILKEKLDSGLYIVAEDYIHTGISWGVASGVDKDYLSRINEPLIKEDIAFFFDGKRFLKSKEEGHAHETDDQLVAQVRRIQQEMSEEYSWHTIDANKPVEDIHTQIWEILKQHLKRSRKKT
ncbi:MAG: hypothetical protein COX81_04095 [Candidatus Magasanikbacteria bacterium CG_4_10_14_0_2_um_filter_37_12]|uniref:Thymidylate kinase-like domain-containing protein n=1 Tax=Candidatus Magasanikbacteria bacterium CG_4_10_14_0_2_um_filter_37_12 TaxID=1974637 RepID=A0A2M7V6H4_9BACT|nr:MAG: hypothetical protein COX81_04095 [Candidatus Magasanikbacteria bacterium CG_4_10_14_0_2_um_filter_37_12]